ncbi:MAG: ComEC/Rec2 family competence protein [Candidatus Tritonobacter lacicola]|nr:ComEC/Rec2 family competence protein [Candidatus Tritonobacter lacicola]
MRYISKAGSLFCALLMLLAPACSGAEDLTVAFINVGQGDGTVIQTPSGKTIVIDAGKGATPYSSWDGGCKAIAPYLEEHGIKKIDMVVATHPDWDHIGGIPYLLENFEIGTVLDCGVPHTTETYKKYLELVKKKGIKFRIAIPGQVLDWGDGVTAEVLAPEGTIEKRQGAHDLNNVSIVIKLTHGDVSFMLVGDCGIEEEGTITPVYGPRLKSNILRAGHHGSDTSSGADFANLVSPEVVIISAGKRNKFGHPKRNIVDRFERMGSKIYRTDFSGNIIVKSNGKDYEISREYDKKKKTGTKAEG